MIHFIMANLPWAMSAITLYQTLAAGKLKRWAWLLAIGNQVLWFIWIISSPDRYGLLPMNLGLTAVFIWNHIKWSAIPKPLDVPLVEDENGFDQVYREANAYLSAFHRGLVFPKIRTVRTNYTIGVQQYFVDADDREVQFVNGKWLPVIRPHSQPKRG